jgi:hypothetical protein
MKHFGLHTWIRISIANLIIVAVIGTIMRFKIGFEFPFFDQKFLLHAHSHFAFSGWITHTLIVLMTSYLVNYTEQINAGIYKSIIISNLILSYGMLISFSLFGYNLSSIALSTASVFTIYFFAWQFLKDVRKVPYDHQGRNWFTAALMFYILSSVGTFYLAWMMATKTFEQHQYLASVYFFLHFQYNGWFFFACMGLLASRIQRNIPEFKIDSKVFWGFALSCVPAYFLSTLWAKLPGWVYMLTVLTAIIQVVVWIKFLQNIRKFLPQIKSKLPVFVRTLFLLVAFCVSIKLMLQLFSTFPSISKLAFGFRPVVIAYLHLVLLAIVSIFLLTYFYSTDKIKINRLTTIAMVIFVSGVFLNEFLLMIQGITSFTYILVPNINEMLFGAAIVILSGSMLLLTSQLLPKTEIK